MNPSHNFAQVARLPLPGDNVAIAVQRLEAGSEIRYGDTSFRLDYTLLEGHRFAVAEIAKGGNLLSWGLPFGRALHDIAPGEYARNASMLKAIGGRSIDFELPKEANFADHIAPYHLDRDHFVASPALEPHSEMRTFMGYARRGNRGVGTRNYIVVLGTSSRTTGYARQLAAMTHKMAASHDHIDGVVAIAHTEGGNRSEPNNRELLLRTLAGFMVHANVGAVLAVVSNCDDSSSGRLRLLSTLAREYPVHILGACAARVCGRPMTPGRGAADDPVWQHFAQADLRIGKRHGIEGRYFGVDGGDVDVIG